MWELGKFNYNFFLNVYNLLAYQLFNKYLNTWIWLQLIFVIHVGYYIDGLENIPTEGAAVLIYYHGTIPLDFYYIMAKVLIYKNRVMQLVGDRFLFGLPGKDYKLLLVFNKRITVCRAVFTAG